MPLLPILFVVSSAAMMPVGNKKHNPPKIKKKMSLDPNSAVNDKLRMLSMDTVIIIMMVKVDSGLYRDFFMLSLNTY